MRGLTRARLDDLYLGVLGYYTGHVIRHGATPQGVDWENAAAQRLRFGQLLRICDFSSRFALNDLGCGYGALRGYLQDYHAGTQVDYLGIDLSSAMIRAATRMWRDRPDARFVVGNASPRCADYSVASGIFNFNPGGSRASWERYVAHTLENLHTTSRLGFAVNFKSRGTLGREPETEEYETSPQKWLRHCTEAFGRPAGIVEGYGLPEFTLLVRRNQRPRFDALPLSSSSSGL